MSAKRLLPLVLAGLLSLGAAACGCASEERGRGPLPGAGVAVGAGKPSAGPPANPGKRPNMIVVMVDDQALNTFKRRYMPHTFRLLVDRGARPRGGGFAVPPLCCPARAGFQTGQYPHNHGVFLNQPGFGAFADRRSQIASWLQAAGYRTGFVGKFMNGFERRKPMPGYHYWWAMLGVPRYTNYRASEQGRPARRYRGERNYATKRITALSRAFIRRSAHKGKPFFLWASHVAPHSRRSRGAPCPGAVAIPLKRDFRRLRKREIRLPKPRNFNEPDVADKAGEVGGLRRLRDRDMRYLTRKVRCVVAALQAVDRSVAQIVRELRRLGELRDTVIVYVSDNGLFYGEHRILAGKTLPYEPALRVPMALRVPRPLLGGRPPERLDEIVATIDLAPTLLELAGARPCIGGGGICRTMDGRSLVGLLRGEDAEWPANRELAIEIGDGCTEGYRALRDELYLYVEWAAPGEPGGCGWGGVELYELDQDPHQLRNLLPPADLESGTVDERALRLAEELSERLERLGLCSGIAGRDDPHGRPLCG